MDAGGPALYYYNALKANPALMIPGSKTPIRADFEIWSTRIIRANRHEKVLLRMTQGKNAPLKWLKDIPMPRREWQEIFNIVGVTNANALLRLAQAGEVLTLPIRLLKTGIDFSGFLIFGLLPAVMVPITLKGPAGAARVSLDLSGQRAFSKMFAQSAKAFWSNGKNMGAWWASPEVVSARMDLVAHGGLVNSSTDALEAMERSMALIHLLKTIPAAGPTLSRFEAAFNSLFDALRVQLWISLAPQVRASGGNLHQLGAMVNKVTGSYNPSLSGLSPTHRALRSSLGSFAPFYRSATFGLLFDMFRGGMRTELALRSLLGLLGAGALWMETARLAGNPDATNPSSPKFATVSLSPGRLEMGEEGINAGLGTAWYSILRTAAGAVRQAQENPEGFYSPDPEDNILATYVFNQAPPLVSMGRDLWLGHRFDGTVLRDEEGWDWRQAARVVYDQFLPMWYFDPFQQSNTEAWMMPFEFFGLRTFPISIFDRTRRAWDWAIWDSKDERVVEWRTQEVKEGRLPTWNTFPRGYISDMFLAYPHLEELQREIRQLDLERGDAFDKDQIDFTEETEKNRRIFNSSLITLDKEWNTTAMSGKGFRDKYKEIKAKYSVNQDALRNQLQYAKVVVHQAEAARARKEKGIAFTGDQVFDLYSEQVLDAPGLEDEFGNFRIQAFETIKTKFWEGINNLELKEYVEKRLGDWKNFPPSLKEYEASRSVLQPYWDLVKNTEYFSPLIQEDLDEMWKMSQRDRANFKIWKPQLAAAEQRLAVIRTNYRLLHPEVDWMLVKFYDATPTPANLKRFQEWRGPEELKRRTDRP